VKDISEPRSSELVQVDHEGSERELIISGSRSRTDADLRDSGNRWSVDS
jgi:hypothetical protein